MHDTIFFFFFSFPLHFHFLCVCLTPFHSLAASQNLKHLAASGRRGSSASDKKSRSKSRARDRSKSPFRSFRWPKKTRPEAAHASHYSDDEETVQRTLGKNVGRIRNKGGWMGTLIESEKIEFTKVTMTPGT